MWVGDSPLQRAIESETMPSPSIPVMKTLRKRRDSTRKVVERTESEWYFFVRIGIP